MTTTRIPAVGGLFAETPEGARLLGSKCTACSTPYFPKSSICRNPDCTDSRIEDASFGPRGVLWSSAVQNFPPPAPAKYDEPYQPYTIGVVDLPEGLRVVGRVVTDDPENLEIGAEVELLVDKLYRDDDGNDVVTWKFRPA